MTTKNTESIYFLLVDDLEENLLALDGLLRRDNLVLLKARSGPDALELLLKHEIALALIDVQMPGMDGFELAEIMRGTERTRRVPIIFLTAGNADQTRRFRGYEAGAVDFLGKPIETDILKSKAQVFFDLACHREELKAAMRENARLLEESRTHAHALKEADRLKDEFLAMLAHELRNPLSAVASAIQIWKQSLLESHHDWAKQVIENQMKTFTRLIDDLLDVSRITHGKIQIRKQVVDPAPSLQQAVASVAPLVRGREHDLEVQFGHGGAQVEVDPTRLEQIVVNLLSNAAKYSENGSRIVLSTNVHDGCLMIEVKDFGLGIAPAQLPKMFELFVQGDRSLERSEGGLGIGLTLVKRLVELHGGTISAQSEGIGLGSTFIVLLPLAAADDQKPVVFAEATTKVDETISALRILVVDDNVDSARGLARLLKLSGHEVQIAHDGPTAAKLVKSHTPRVIILDIGLPGMDGYELAEQLLKDGAAETSYLIAITGYGRESDRARAKQVGFRHHLTKPVDFDRLTEILQSMSSDKNGKG